LAWEGTTAKKGSVYRKVRFPGVTKKNGFLPLGRGCERGGKKKNTRYKGKENILEPRNVIKKTSV